MNQKTTYEITIADKLGQLHAPDMREAIWSRIEAELDLDLPGDDNPSGPEQPKSPDWTSFTRRFGTFAVIVAVVTVFFINKQQDKPAINRDDSPAAIETIQPAPGSGESPPGEPAAGTAGPRQEVNSSEASPTPVSDSFINIAADQPAIFNDTTTPAPLVSTPPEKQPVIIPPIKQDTVPKKSKGFKGITDSDYRISLKKDSVP